MKKIQPKLRTVETLSYLLALAVTVASLGGIFLFDTYSKESASYAAQGVGQDIINLGVAVPLLLLSAYRTARGGRFSLFLLAGTLAYTAYSYVIYAFAVHFNRFFFSYCAALGLSVYALGSLVAATRKEEVASWFDRSRSTRLPAGALGVIAVLFYFIWLSEDIPSVLQGTIPKSVAENNFFTNPVHVLDLSLFLPALLVSAIQLWRKKPLGYLVFPSMMAFTVLMTVAIFGMVVASRMLGQPVDLMLAWIFAVISLAGSAILFYFLRSLKRRG